MLRAVPQSCSEIYQQIVLKQVLPLKKNRGSTLFAIKNLSRKQCREFVGSSMTKITAKEEIHKSTG